MLACIISHNLTPKGAKIADKGRKGLVIAKGYIYPHKSKKKSVAGLWRADRVQGGVMVIGSSKGWKCCASLGAQKGLAHNEKL